MGITGLPTTTVIATDIPIAIITGTLIMAMPTGITTTGTRATAMSTEPLTQKLLPQNRAFGR